MKVLRNMKMKTNYCNMCGNLYKTDMMITDNTVKMNITTKSTMWKKLKSVCKDVTTKVSFNCENKKTKKCQPAARDTMDLIQTTCVPDSWLARLNKKNKQNVKKKTENKENSSNVTLAEVRKLTKLSSQSINTKTKKCQAAARDTMDLIQTTCVPDSRLARLNKKNKLNVKKKYENKEKSSNVTLIEAKKRTKLFSQSIKTKTKKCQAAARDTMDLIQTTCVPDSRLARLNKKNKLNVKKKNENKENSTKVTLVEVNKLTKLFSQSINTKTKKCQAAARDTMDLIQTTCVPDSRLARLNKKNKPNEKKKIQIKRNFTDVTLSENYGRKCSKSKWKNKKSKMCQSAARVAPDLIQTECNPDSGLARNIKKNKLNEKIKIKTESTNVTLKTKDSVRKTILIAESWALANKCRNKLKKCCNGNIRSNLKISHWNSGSKKWKNKKVEIIQILEDRKSDIMFISEANIFSEDQDSEVCIPGYSLIPSKSLETLGYTRMVAIIKERINVEVVPQWMDHEVASVWLKILKKGGKKLYVAGIYREHKLLNQIQPNLTDEMSLQTARWDKFVRSWESASINSEVIVIGDTNLDEVKWAVPDPINVDMVNIIKSRIETLGYQQLIRGVTRSWPNQNDSLIDKIWVNCPDKIATTENIVNGTTDHNIVEVIIKIRGKICTPVEVQKRSLKNWNLERYKARIKNIDWTLLYRQTNISIAYNVLETKILEILDSEAPMATVQIKKVNKKWITEETKIKIDTRDKMREKARLSKKQEDWDEYKKQRNMCTTSLRKDRKLDTKKQFELFEQTKDVSKLYSLTKRRLGWDSSLAPTSFLVEGKQVTSPKMMADIQIDCFIEKSRKLSEEIPVSSGDPHWILRKALEKWGEKATDRKKFKLREITTLETAELINKLGNTKSFGHDKMDALSLKIVASSLLKPLNFIINLSLATKKFANQWRIGKLIPLFKGKGLVKVDPKNYRPIAILPVISKIVERAVQNQMVDFLLETGQLNTNHNAYLKNRSTTTTILQMLDSIYEATDENLMTTLMTIDESNAFESVSHELLVEKMVLYNFEEETINWFKDYLNHRSSYVVINAKASKMTPNKQGVPQGSVLGPLLYTLFINELPDLVKEDDCSQQSHKEDDLLFGNNCKVCGSVPCYADDASVIFASNSREQNQEKLITHLKRTTTFLNRNKLNLNKTKTTISELMTSQKRTRLTGSPPVLMVLGANNEQKRIEVRNYTRLLGCSIGQNLGWSEHLETGEKALLPRLRKQLGSLKLLARELPTKSKLLLSNGLIISKISYMAQAWGGAQKNQIRKIQVIMNQTARFITNSNKRTRTRKLMEYCNWLTAKEIVMYQSLVSMWRIVYLKIPLQIEQSLAISEDKLICTKPARLKITKRSFKHRTITTWNKLPQWTREIMKIDIFKKKNQRMDY